jgi:RNA polymerase sigma-70 factor, ECF subfamily
LYLVSKFFRLNLSSVANQLDWNEMERLFKAYLNLDAVATRQLFTLITKALEGFFRARMGAGAGNVSDADDMVQATLLKIHFARDRFDPQQSLKTWVFTIASRSLIDHWRGAAQEAEHFAQPTGQDEDNPSEVDMAPSDLLSPEQKTMLHGDLNEALKKLKPTERSIVYLYGIEGLSMNEIAQALSLTESATKVRAHRAYVEMRKQLER